jgi:CRP-like cAMP-binding protein
MSLPYELQLPIENSLLAMLPKAESDALLPHLDLIRLNNCEVLYEMAEPIRHVYFLNSGMVSMLSMTSEGYVVEVATVGNEGVVGLPIILNAYMPPYRTVVLVQGSALKMKSHIFKREFEQASVLKDLLLRYTYILLAEISQSAVCNRFHTLRQRLCRWLLLTCDRVNSNDFQITQEILSSVLGVRRGGVTVVIGDLQKEGLILYRRNRIILLDGGRLRDNSCECYSVIRSLTSQVSSPLTR